MVEIVSPNDGTILADLPEASEQEALACLAAARERFADRTGWLEPHERLAILERLAHLVSDEADAFARLIAAEGGKPLKDARVEVARAIEGIKLAGREWLRVMRGETIPMGLTEATTGRIAFTCPEPIGVVLAISAFNHPLNLIVHQAIPAIATGCPVLIKPARSTPLCCQKLCELIKQAGLPDGWCHMLLCDHDVTETLAAHENVAFVNFIGSANIGWNLRRKLADGTRCALEHGGVAPVMVSRQAELPRMVAPLLKGGFYHAGQVCVSTQRIFIDKTISESLYQALAEGAAQLSVGDARDEHTDVGPLIRPEETERIHRWVREAIDDGAQCLCGGQPVDDRHYAPTVLLNPPADSTISQKEVFGPVLCLYEYNDPQTAIQQANGIADAFQAAIFTQDIDEAMRWSRLLDASAVMINDHTAFRADWMPFGGRHRSGLGLGGIGYSMNALLSPKLTVIHSGGCV